MVRISITLFFLVSGSLSYADSAQPETVAQLVCRKVDFLHSPDQDNPNPDQGVFVLDQIPTLQPIGAEKVYLSGEEFFDPKQGKNMNIMYESSFQFRYYDTKIDELSDQTIDSVLSSEPLENLEGLMQKMTSSYIFSQSAQGIVIKNIDTTGKHENASVNLTEAEKIPEGRSGRHKCRIRQVPNPYKGQSYQPVFEGVETGAEA